MTAYPSIVYLRILQNCNARCVMCDSYKKSREHADLDYVKNLINEFEELGVNEVRFTGGETLLYRSIKQLLQFTTEKKLKFSLISNGAYFQEFKRELTESKISKIICSLDSPYPEVHNKVRRTKNLLEKASQGIKAIQELSCASREKPIQFIVNTVVSSVNYDHLRAFLPFLQDHSVRYWNLIPVHGEQPINMSQDQIDTAMTEIHHILLSIAQNRLDLTLNIQDPMDFFSTAIHGTRPQELTGGLTKCHVVSQVAFIDTVNGQLTGCNDLMYSGFDEIIAHNIFNKSFKSVWCDYLYRKTREEFSCQALNKCERCEPTNIKFNKHLNQIGADTNVGRVPVWF